MGSAAYERSVRGGRPAPCNLYSVGAESSRMLGLCHMCGASAGNTCRFCGRPACKDHYDAKAGACLSCLGGTMAGNES